MKPQKTQSTYQVDWYRNGFNYRTTIGVPKDALPDIKRQAKLLGEKVSIIKED